MGLIGYGNIGTQTSIMAEAMGMKVKFYDTDAKLPLGNAQAV
jgi:D-3-phosphoglycerate dehydrogenase